MSTIHPWISPLNPNCRSSFDRCVCTFLSGASNLRYLEITRLKFFITQSILVSLVSFLVLPPLAIEIPFEGPESHTMKNP